MPFDSYIKPQPASVRRAAPRCCMPFDSYIKPQLPLVAIGKVAVVCLLIPTSNHNYWLTSMGAIVVVCLLIPTSNHNSLRSWVTGFKLYAF